MFRGCYRLQEKEKEELGVFGRPLATKSTSKRAVDPKYVDEDGRSHLHLGVLQYCIDELTFEAALKAGCDVNAPDQSKCIPLHYAAMRGLDSCVTKLLKHGSTLDVLDGDDRSPLMLASSHGHISVLRTLIKAGCNVNLSNSKGELALHYSCMGGHKECIELLLKYKAKVNYPDNIGSTPLSLLCKLKGNVSDIVKMVIKAGANVDKLNNQGRGPIHWAASVGNKYTMKSLIDADVDLDVLDKTFRSPFIYAIALDHHETLQYLCDAGCDRSTIDGLNGTAMALAALKGYDKTVQVLLGAGEDPNELGYFGMTPLMASVYECHIDVTETLLKNGADPNIISRMGLTALLTTLCHLKDKTVVARHELMVTLIKYGANVNHQMSSASIFTQVTNGKNCPISFAITHGYISFVKILLEAGSDIKPEDISETLQKENTEDVYDLHEIMKLIKSYRSNALSLRHQCRLYIRKLLGEFPFRKIPHLDIAPGLEKYLNFEDLMLYKPERVSAKIMLPSFMATIVDVKACGLDALKGSLLHDIIEKPVKDAQPPGPCQCDVCQRIRSYKTDK